MIYISVCQSLLLMPQVPFIISSFVVDDDVDRKFSDSRQRCNDVGCSQSPLKPPPKKNLHLQLLLLLAWFFSIRSSVFTLPLFLFSYCLKDFISFFPFSLTIVFEMQLLPILNIGLLVSASVLICQCDQIGRFIALWATFQSLWQQLFCPNNPHY